LRNTVQGLVVPPPGSRIPEVDEQTLRAWQTTAALVRNPSTPTEAIDDCAPFTRAVLQTVRDNASPADGIHLVGFLLEAASSPDLLLKLSEEFTTHPDARIQSRALATSAAQG